MGIYILRIDLSEYILNHFSCLCRGFTCIVNGSWLSTGCQRCSRRELEVVAANLQVPQI